MIPFLNKRPPNSLIGLKLERNRLEGVVLRRSGAGFQVQRTFQASLSLDPLTNDPELVGREIRNHLNEAGVRERRCAVCMPLNWALTLQTQIPAIPEADVSGFLDIEAEKGFPYAPHDLSISVSRYPAPGGTQYATIVAIPRNHLVLLGQTLKAAQLKPVSFSLAISALQSSNKESGSGAVALLVGERSVELQVSAGGGVAALRSLEGVVETDGNHQHIDADLVAREIKITLGQLPRALSETVRKLRIFGRPELAQPLLKEIQPRVKTMGLEIETGAVPPVNGFPLPLQADKCLSPTVCLAARCIVGYPPGFEFLPPRVSAWSQVSTRFSSRKLVSVGAAAGAVVLLVSGAFLVQHLKLSSLQSKWRSIEPKVVQLEGLQQQIRKFRPWFDESHRALRIIRRVTEAFPEDGVVTAKTLELKDLSVVICTGSAQNDQALVKMRDRLAAAKEVKDLNIEQTRGKSPMQFSIKFRWVEEGSREN